MKNIIKTIFTSLIIIAVAVGLYVAKDWNSTSALFPRLVGFPLLALSIIVLLIDLTNAQRQKKAAVQEKQIEEAIAFRKKLNASMLLFGWLIWLIVLIWAIGVNVAVPIYIFPYMKIKGEFSYLKSSLSAIFTGLGVFLIFNVIFSVVWPQGALQKIMGF